ncbi:MAG: M23 family metallopeptidase [Candidatus Thioglobus sp.]|uniref:murein hydrolase activator EnvC family protein n=1 Tax=Candidatus Thioglobus sp. TaxID=2026721 RepID=UPI00261FEF1C|nr:M23 family metallopeptidase [Candidatus Thioglobus sp.]MDC9726602.1 M23 family metallopeptidase [Candidatus Thioglobus sp.]
MWIKLLSIALVLSLSGCYSQSPKRAVIVVEKSSQLENINHQRLEGATIPEKISRITDSSAKNNNKKTVKKIAKKTTNWRIPVNAKVSQTFSKQKPGVVFATHNGQAIRSIRDGKVVYIGDKIKSDGTIIIIRHPLGFSSIYTQTQALQASLGDQVKKGDVIANTNDQPFYFEMKKFDQAINPLKYLK